MGICGSKSRNRKDDYEDTNMVKLKTSHQIRHAGNASSAYNLDKILGKGGYGQVWRASLKQSPDIYRAIKIVQKDKLEEEELERIKDEVDILSRLDHKNIIQFYEYFEDRKKLYIVSEYCSGGELFDKITTKSFFSEKEAKNIMGQLLSAIKFCHLHGVIHRDIKPENIIFTTKLGPEIKVIDFGASTQFLKNAVFSESIGTPYYIAPEVLKNNYNKKCDIWSCGVILYILLTGSPPFGGNSRQEIIRNVSKGKYSMKRPEFDNASSNSKDLIKKMLTFDFNSRITATEALEHPWFKEKGDKEEAKMDSSILNNFRSFNVVYS